MPRFLSLLALFSIIGSQLLASELPEGWQVKSPRDEIRPEFAFENHGGPTQKGSFVIRHDDREGLDGWFQKSFEVKGGNFVKFHAMRKLHNVKVPRRSALVRVLWQNDEGKMVSADVPKEQAADLGHVPSAEPEHPVDGATDANGWTTVDGFYQVPKMATRAVVELHLQWAPGGSVEWSDVELSQSDPPKNRTVKLAAVHYKPSGKSARENCEEFAPLIARAANEKADLVVLGETVPSVGVLDKSLSFETAESIPGPTTNYFGELAKKHNLHIVLSLYERDKHLVFNTAVLIGPEGQLIGKYRKVCLPHGEVERGIAPGNDYPVFDTRFGKVGLMVCYDGFFPEVARELSNRGAEVIAWPVWGCNPQLAKARACENHVYVVSSTFMQPKDGWMISAVFDTTGKPVAHADQWGDIAIAEVNLNRPYIGPWNLGDFRTMIQRHRPVQSDEVVKELPTYVGKQEVSLPAISEPMMFDTPEADAILSKLQVFPSDNPWNQDVSNWPLHPNSKRIVASIGAEKVFRCNTDMGFVLVPPNQPRVDVQIGAYAEESDKGPYPVPENLPIEGWPVNYLRDESRKTQTLSDVQADKLKIGGDRHAIVVDPVNRMLYEFGEVYRRKDGWHAIQASIFDLKTNTLRPDGWTSTDAAGLPIFPAIVRYDELQRGVIHHAMRVTVTKTRRAYVAPATHFASRLTDENLPRMGERFRLRKDFNVASFSPEVQTILNGLKTYGMLVADNGIDWAISIAPDPRIPELHEELRKIKGSDFEVVVSP